MIAESVIGSPVGDPAVDPALEYHQVLGFNRSLREGIRWKR